MKEVIMFQLENLLSTYILQHQWNACGYVNVISVYFMMLFIQVCLWGILEPAFMGGFCSAAEVAAMFWCRICLIIAYLIGYSNQSNT